MTDRSKAGTFKLGERTVKRMGYGAMQLAGPGVFGPPKDHDTAIAVLREAVACGVNHIDTSDFYGPHVTNQIIREALHPYPDDLVIVTKIGARRGPDASWNPAMSPGDLKSAVEDNLRNLRLEVLEVVNLRIMGAVHGPAEGPIEAPLTVLADLQRKGLVRHIGLSNVTANQIEEGRRICDIVCVQNNYNIAHRDDDATDRRSCGGRHCLCAVLPARRLHPAAIDGAVRRSQETRRHADADRARLAAEARAEHPAHSRHVVARALARKSRGFRTGTAGRRDGPAGRDRQKQRAND